MAFTEEFIYLSSRHLEVSQRQALWYGQYIAPTLLKLKVLRRGLQGSAGTVTGNRTVPGDKTVASYKNVISRGQRLRPQNKKLQPKLQNNKDTSDRISDGVQRLPRDRVGAHQP